MFGLFCKGLHCAGCGKGLPFSLVLIVIGIVAVRTPAFDAAMGGAIEAAAIAIASSFLIGVIGTGIALSLMMRKGPPIVIVRTEVNRVSYSQMKFLETGDPEWLALMGPIPPVLKAKVVGDEHDYRAEVVHYGDDS